MYKERNIYLLDFYYIINNLIIILELKLVEMFSNTKHLSSLIDDFNKEKSCKILLLFKLDLKTLDMSINKV